MLKLLWSWVLLVVLASLLLLYQPKLLSAHIDLFYAGDKYSFQLWLLMFLLVLVIAIVLSISNIIFKWQRRLLINKCKKLKKSIKSVEYFLETLVNQGDEKVLLKNCKQLPLPKSLKRVLQKTLLREFDSEGSMFSLWWHGHWSRIAELLEYSPIKSVWLMNFYCHIFLLDGIERDLLPSFLKAWQNYSAKMLQNFPTIALQVQGKIFACYDTYDSLQLAWNLLPKKIRRREDILLSYAKAAIAFSAWSDIKLLLDTTISRNWDKNLSEWYFKNMPPELLDITQLQKWHKQTPLYLDKFILLALARAYASQGEQQTAQTLIAKIDDTGITDGVI